MDSRRHMCGWLLRLTPMLTTGCMVIIVVGCAVTPPQEPIEAERPAEFQDPAEIASLQGNYEEAIRIYQKRLTTNPSNTQTLYYLGYAHGQLGDHHREIYYYEKAIDNGLLSDQVYANLGMAYFEVGQTEEAMGSFKRSLDLNPNNADAHFGLGMALKRQNDRQAAEKSLKNAVALDPQFIYFRENLALFYQENKQWFKAAEQYEAILELDPENEDAQRRLDRISERLRQQTD